MSFGSLRGCLPSFLMRTIRFRSRVLVLAAVGCLALVGLLKGLSDSQHVDGEPPDPPSAAGDHYDPGNVANPDSSPVISGKGGGRRRPSPRNILLNPPKDDDLDKRPPFAAVPQEKKRPAEVPSPFEGGVDEKRVFRQQLQAGHAELPKIQPRPLQPGDGAPLPPRQLPPRQQGQIPPVNDIMGGQQRQQQIPARKAGNAPTEAAGGRGKKAYPVFKRGAFIPPHKVVHLDLKGAAPRVPYLLEVFQLIAKLGGTGVLLEWEDMFPYTGELAITRHRNSYSESDVRTILNAANQAGLDIIPLVQTFGHLEWILKHEKFAKYRQVERYPQVICLGDDEAVQLVKNAVDQVMSFHRRHPTHFFHIGADEAFQVGMCEKDQQVMKTLDNSREKLMLRHIRTIAQYVREKYGAKVLMWHDMLNNVDTGTIKEYLADIAEPVVWAYAENLNDFLMPDMWQRFSEAFPYIWGGSSYKGADGPSRYYSNVPHYLQNHLSWTQQMTREHKNFVEFRGLILTGWQRFDHFAILCEILPVGIPSMAVNLAAVEEGKYDRSVLQTASQRLDCSSTLEIESMGVGAYCKFPGAKVYQSIQQLRLTLANIQQNLYDDYQVRGWLAEFNMRHNYSSAWYLDQIMDKVNMHLSDLEALAKTIRSEMAPIFWPDTIDEFIMEYVEEDLNRLRRMGKKGKEIAGIKTFPVRPFLIKGSTSEWKGDPARPKLDPQQPNLGGNVGL